MRKYFVFVVAIAAGLALCSTAWAMQATATNSDGDLTVSQESKDVRIEIVNAPANVRVDIVFNSMNSSKPASALSDATGTATTVLNFGNQAKNASARVAVYLEEGKDGATLTLVAEGGQAPEDCDRERQDDDSDCREGGIIWLTSNTDTITVDWQSGSIFTNDSYSASLVPQRGFIAAFGPNLASLANAECDASPDFFVSISCDLERSGFDISAAGEFVFVSWLAAGVSYERIDGVSQEQIFSAEFDPRAQVSFQNGRVRPTVLSIYARPTLPLGSMFSIFVTAGAAYWTVDASGTVVASFDGQELERQTETARLNGWSATFGGGVDVFPHPRFGVRGAFTTLALRDGDVFDERINRATMMILIALGPQ